MYGKGGMWDSGKKKKGGDQGGGYTGWGKGAVGCLCGEDRRAAGQRRAGAAGRARLAGRELGTPVCPHGAPSATRWHLNLCAGTSRDEPHGGPGMRWAPGLSKHSWQQFPRVILSWRLHKEKT